MDGGVEPVAPILETAPLGLAAAQAEADSGAPLPNIADHPIHLAAREGHTGGARLGQHWGSAAPAAHAACSAPLLLLNNLPDSLPALSINY